MKVIIRMGMVIEFIIMQMEIDMKVIMLIKKKGKGKFFFKSRGKYEGHFKDGNIKEMEFIILPMVIEMKENSMMIK